MELSSHVDKLIDGQRDEIHEHDFDHGPLPRDCRTDRDAGQRLFRDRGVAYALGTELVDQSARHAKGAAVDADVFAHQEDRGIAPQFSGQCFANELCEGDRTHDSLEIEGED